MNGSVWCGRGVALFVALGLLAAACGEDVEVGRDEAIEVLVLDGVPRERAECIIDGADGVISLAKVTGVDTDITEDELTDLARVSASCVFIDDTSVGVIDDQPRELDAEGAGIEFDIAAEVERLVSGGIAPAVAECVGIALSASPDPAAAAASDNFLTEAVRICEP